MAETVQKIKETLIKASTVFSEDKKVVLQSALEREMNPTARWVLEMTLQNAQAAEKNRRPLCDDTGIPHIIIEIGGKQGVCTNLLKDIRIGIAEGMRELPCRPMAVRGNEIERLEQSQGLHEDPSALELAPIRIKMVEEDILRLHVLMQGGGPEIRGKTYRVFHKHSIKAIMDEVIGWASDGAALLGCTPCTPAIGIGRTHFESNALMLEAMTFGKFDIQSTIEKEFTDRLNAVGSGPLGLGGTTTALATFLRVGPQRASGVRIVSLRLCCSVEPRVASVDL